MNCPVCKGFFFRGVFDLSCTKASISLVFTHKLFGKVNKDV